MDSFKNLRTAVICFAAVVILGLVISLLASGYSPSDAFVKEMVQKQMAKRLKGNTITSISIVRGNSFHLEAHASKVPYGTLLYPVVVTVNYVTKPADGSAGETKQLTRTLNLYKDSTHHWVNDDELH